MKLLVFALAALLPFLAQSVPSGPRCRCFPSDACWPSPSAFASLSTQLSQPLLHPVPPASACYPVAHPSGNCTAVQAETSDALWRADQPGAMQEANFERYTFANGSIDACYVNTTPGARCGQGSIPVIGVDARTPQDVQAAVKFAGEKNLRLVVKNTGHDFLGRSTARGSFLIWTHYMKNITVHDDFVPAGASQSQKYEAIAAITLDSGAQWHEAYSAAEAAGRLVVGGLSVEGTVGAAGGWILGGGHSMLSPTHGLGVDNVLQFTIVVASGAHLTVSAHAHADLFWALRGGGGGTFGVLTSVTYRTYPSVPLAVALFTANTSDAGTYRELVAEMVRVMPGLADAGWGGYGGLSPAARSMYLFLGSPGKDAAQANATFAPFFDFVHSLDAEKIDVQAGTQGFASFYDATAVVLAGMTPEAGDNIEIASRFFSRSLIANDIDKAVDTLLALPDAGFNFVGGGAVTQVNPDDAAVHPAWRDTVLHVYTSISWPDGTPTAQINELKKGMNESIQLLGTVSNATYLNEASLYEPEWQTTFFGSHYDRLKAIKKAYDPQSLFVVAEGVGSEDWNTDLTCLL